MIPEAVFAFTLLAAVGVLSAVVPFAGPIAAAWFVLDLALKGSEGIKAKEVFESLYLPLALGVFIGTHYRADAYSLHLAQYSRAYLGPWMIAFSLIFWLRALSLTRGSRRTVQKT